MSSSEEALLKFESWRAFHAPLRWTILPSPSSASLKEIREIRAEIDFVARDRGYVRIWASERLQRSFSLSECSEIEVAKNSMTITFLNGEIFLLVEEKPN
jgi:hypothetical protein